jgi:hypothetical protein
LSLRKLRQKEKKRAAIADERQFGRVFGLPDPTARKAIRRYEKNGHQQFTKIT